MSEQDPNLPTQTDEQPEPVAPQPEIEPTVPETTQTAPEVEPPKDEIDYKAKFAASTSENQILAAKVAEYENSRKELTNEPAESDLRATFPEWDSMTYTEQRLATKTFSATQIATTLLEKDRQREAKAAWNTDLELAIAQNPSLQGKEQQFKDFANKPTHRGVATDVLVDAFLHKSGATPAPKSAPPALEPGNGGPRGPIQSKSKYSADEQLALQKSDPRKYRDMLLAGEFDD